MSNHATKEIKNFTGVDTSNLTAKKDFIALKAEVDQLGINKLVNVLTDLNNLKSKVYDLDLDKFNSVPVEFKKK